MLHAKIFKELYSANKSELSLPSQKSLAEAADIAVSQFSRFLSGQQDIKSTDFVKLIQLMPPDFQKQYCQRLEEELNISIYNDVNLENGKKKVQKWNLQKAS